MTVLDIPWKCNTQGTILFPEDERDQKKRSALSREKRRAIELWEQKLLDSGFSKNHFDHHWRIFCRFTGLVKKYVEVTQETAVTINPVSLYRFIHAFEPVVFKWLFQLAGSELETLNYGLQTFALWIERLLPYLLRAGQGKAPGFNWYDVVFLKDIQQATPLDFDEQLHVETEISDISDIIFEAWFRFEQKKTSPPVTSAINSSEDIVSDSPESESGEKASLILEGVKTLAPVKHKEEIDIDQRTALLTTTHCEHPYTSTPVESQKQASPGKEDDSEKDINMESEVPGSILLTPCETADCEVELQQAPVDNEVELSGQELEPVDVTVKSAGTQAEPVCARVETIYPIRKRTREDYEQDLQNMIRAIEGTCSKSGPKPGSKKIKPDTNDNFCWLSIGLY